MTNGSTAIGPDRGGGIFVENSNRRNVGPQRLDQTSSADGKREIHRHLQCGAHAAGGVLEEARRRRIQVARGTECRVQLWSATSAGLNMNTTRTQKCWR